MMRTKQKEGIRRAYPGLQNVPNGFGQHLDQINALDENDGRDSFGRFHRLNQQC